MILGVGGAVGAAALAKNRPLAKKLWDYAMTGRQQLMLSGWAPIKSVLGNVGGTAINAAERRTLRPLKELFSRQTLRDAKDAYKNPSFHPSYGTSLPGPTPGRLMGAMDTASQKALVRSGLTPDEAERVMFQNPLGDNYGKFSEVLDSETARYFFPFRRTPFNQFYEGLDAIKSRQHPAILAGMTGAGAVHGAATEDEQYPVSIGFGTALASKYGLPYVLGAVGGRYLAGGNRSGGIAGQALPVSEYSIESGFTNPIPEPAALRALRQLRGQ